MSCLNHANEERNDMLHTITLLGYDIVAGRINDCVSDIARAISEHAEPRSFACLNPHSHVIAKQDSAFYEALQAVDWLVPDGAGVVLASLFLQCPVQERITGSDVFYGLHDQMNRQGGGSIFFLGSSEEILAEIRKRMGADYPNLRVVGTFSPPYKAEFSPTEQDEMIASINAVKPDVLWVGMTAPKQEKWIHQNRHRLDVKFVGAIGAVFDFYTGKVKRSHPVFQKLGLEWLPRLFQEPRRLWKRMGISAPIFIWDVLKAGGTKKVG
jgi:N-acetylglucosaminyldiphosphoundecaprenol N-acetyl-beta-D-mannosaminyltransferase